MIMGYLWPFSVQGHLGAIRYTCLKMACNIKMAGRRVKGIEIWDPGGGGYMYMAYI